MKGQLKRKFGIALTALGTAITASLFALFLWVLTRELYLSGNLSFFWQKDFYYILPVFIFLFPGVYFVHIGRKIIRSENIGLMPSIEIAIMLIIGTALIYLNLAADSDYVDQARQTPSAHNKLSR